MEHLSEIQQEILDSIRPEKKYEAEPKPEPAPPVVDTPREALVKSEVQTDENGMSYQDVPFSDAYWEPTHVPDHLVRVYTGYDSPPVPSPYVPPKPEFERLSLAFTLGLKVNVVGPTGCGKTLMYEYYSATTGRPFLRIEHNSELDKATVFGQVHINVDEEGKQSTDFVLGNLPLSMSAPTVTVLDELARAPGFANILYQRVLDRRELSMPEMKGGVGIITPHADWIVCASDNTKGNGDDLDVYSATNVQDASFINRWDVLIEQDYLNQGMESQLIADLAPEMQATVVEKLAKFSSLMHQGFKSGELQTAFSPRNLTTICKLASAGVPIKEAIDMNFLSRATKSEYSDIKETITAVFG